MAKAKNAALTAANRAKEDEFYKKITDIEKELKYYKQHFKGKIVFMNCDDPETSNFWQYFMLNFSVLELKKIIATHYETDKPSYKLEYSLLPDKNGQITFDVIRTPLKQNGDFRKAIFPNYRKEMCGVPWGILYNEHGNKPFDAAALEADVKRLMQDEDVSKKPGIYSYLFDKDERHLNIRAFTPKMKREAYERQNGICSSCNNHFELNEMEADHITPWHLGGATIAENCQMLCRDCNRRKSGK